MILLQVLVRLLAFVGKELVDVLRRPGALASLVLGPFLILAVFGYGYRGLGDPLRAIVVVPAESGLPTDLATYQKVAEGLTISEIDATREPAEQKLSRHETDVVVVVPPDAEARFRAGEQATIDFVINVANPEEQAYAGVLAARLANKVNTEILTQFVGEGQQVAIEAGAGQEALRVPASVVAAPTTSELTNLSPTAPGVTAFYGPAVLALVLQHLALTMVGLSLVRERTTGLIELFRVAPVSALEVVIGKVLGFGVFAAVIGAASLAVLVMGLGVPVLGAPWQLAAVLGLLLLSSLGLGLVVGLISDSERQAVQLSLLFLLASVFLAGFINPQR
ncbi:MAG: ABC transporter permease, partial [Chloroflexi bacterium]|nr:ABC transporter permease [Chloroflexota bacterium]